MSRLFGTLCSNRLEPAFLHLLAPASICAFMYLSARPTPLAIYALKVVGRLILDFAFRSLRARLRQHARELRAIELII
jgi:hypothetical protein